MNDYEKIVAVPVPKATRTYKPVSNEDLVTALKMQIELADMHVTHERYELGAKDQQMFGVLVVEPNELNSDKPLSSRGLSSSGSHGVGSAFGLSIMARSNEMSRCVGVRNSYNKTLPIGFVAGSNVTVCSNLMFEGTIKMLRKHTINIFQDLDNLIYDAVYGVEKEFAKIVQDAERFKKVDLNVRDAAELCGRMYIEEQIITSTQLNVIKTEWNNLTLTRGADYGQTGWDFMNHCTHALKKSPPRERMESQLNVNQFLKEELLQL